MPTTHLIERGRRTSDRRHWRAVGGKEQAQAGFRPDIDGLRAVAVLAVVLFHAGVPGIGGGFVGVDIFFVISASSSPGCCPGRSSAQAI